MNFNIKQTQIPQVVVDRLKTEVVIVEAEGEKDLIKISQRSEKDIGWDDVRLNRQQLLELTKLAINHGVFTLSDLL